MKINFHRKEQSFNNPSKIKRHYILLYTFSSQEANNLCKYFNNVGVGPKTNEMINHETFKRQSLDLISSNIAHWTFEECEEDCLQSWDFLGRSFCLGDDANINWSRKLKTQNLQQVKLINLVYDVTLRIKQYLCQQKIRK